jgi:hypothetical protein
MTLDQIENLINRLEKGDVQPTTDEYKRALKATHAHMQQMLSILDDNIGRDDDPYGVLKDLQHEYVSLLYSS